MSIKEHPPLHVPVLLEEVLKQLNPRQNEAYLDLTAGYGGHAENIFQLTKNFKDSVLVDRDDMAQNHLKRFINQGVCLIHTDFVSAAKRLIAEQKKFDLVLIDLGVSSPQLDIAERGFSFLRNGPLDMRMDRRQKISAYDFVNNADKKDLINVIVEYGEETRRTAERYADAIISNRPISTTGELAEIIEKNYVSRGKKRIHPATRTFQAIRMYINDELKQVREIMPLLPKLLNKGGRVGVISFHSLEDRIVKQYFSEQQKSGYEAELHILTKHPIDGALNDVHNPRSRSAKLRVAVKK